MPFDYEEYESKCSMLSPEALQKEWENYTRHIAGGATSTAGSVLFAPFTAGASLVGLGLATPRIHNARKKRAIIETHLQAHSTTHHTRKRDVVAPMAVAGTLGGLTLGFAGAGADLIAGEAVGKGIEYAASHAALEVAGATLEHKHDESKKTKDQLELAKKYGYVEGITLDQKTNTLSPPAGTPSNLRKTRSESHLESLAYGSLPGQKRPNMPPRPLPQSILPPHADSQESTTILPPRLEVSDLSSSQSTPDEVDCPSQTTQQDKLHPNGEAKSSCENGMKLPFFGLLDHDEAEKRGLQWDSARGMYVQPEGVSAELPDSSAVSPSKANLEPAPHESGELEQLLSQLLTENSDSERPDITPALLVPDGNAPLLPPRPQSFALPPRPKSSIGTYSTPTYAPGCPQQQSFLPPPPPPPPPQRPNQQKAAPESVQLQYSAQQYYNPIQYSSSPSQSLLTSPALPLYQPTHVKFPQYQYFPPPPPSPSHIPALPARRPSPQPIQHQHSEARTARRQESITSISTVSSVSSSITSLSTISAVSTPPTSYSASATASTSMSSYSYDPARYQDSTKEADASMCLSSKHIVTSTYFPPPPAGIVAGKTEKRRSYFG